MVLLLFHCLLYYYLLETRAQTEYTSSTEINSEAAKLIE